jgi:hypothetical protein
MTSEAPFFSTQYSMKKRTSTPKNPLVVQTILRKVIGQRNGLKIKGAKQPQGMIHFPARFGTLEKINKLIFAKGMLLSVSDPTALRDMEAYTVVFQVMPSKFPSIPKFRRKMDFGVKAMQAVHATSIAHPCLYADMQGMDLVLNPLAAGMYTMSPTPVYFTVFNSLQNYKVLAKTMLQNIDVMIRVERLLYALAIMGYDPSQVDLADIVYHSRTFECKLLRLSNITKTLPQWRVEKAKDALRESKRRDFEMMWPAPRWLREMSSNILSSKRLDAYTYSESTCPLYNTVSY